MEVKVCTKCKDSKVVSEFSKGKAACRKCIYNLYHRPSHIRRLRAKGSCPKEEYILVSPEIKKESQRKADKRYRQKKKDNSPPSIPKESWAKKPPIIRGKMSDTMTPEEIKVHKNTIKRNYRKENREKHTQQRKRDYDLSKNKPEVKIARNIRKRLKKFLAPGKRLGSFSKMIGCTKQGLLEYLETLFKPGMTWDNYGPTGWHIDHIKPLAAFDVTDKTTWTEINKFTNLRPMWANENSTKSSYWEGVKWSKGKPVTANS